VGIAIVRGSDEEGDTVDAKSSVEDIRKLVTWTTKVASGNF